MGLRLKVTDDVAVAVHGYSDLTIGIFNFFLHHPRPERSMQYAGAFERDDTTARR